MVTAQGGGFKERGKTAFHKTVYNLLGSSSISTRISFKALIFVFGRSNF